MYLKKILSFTCLLTLYSLTAFAGDPSDECFVNLASDTDLKPLQGKVTIGGKLNEQSLDILSNNNKPNLIEKQAISSWYNKVLQCVALGESFRKQNYPPQINSILESYVAEANSLRADLYAGKITYGEFAKQRATLYNRSLNEQSTVEQQLRAQQQTYQQQQAEMAQRAAIAENQRKSELLNNIINQQGIFKPRPMYQPQPLPQQQPLYKPPTQTNCQWIGNQFHCTSQ
jgi:hypothetical protein